MANTVSGPANITSARGPKNITGAVGNTGRTEAREASTVQPSPSLSTVSAAPTTVATGVASTITVTVKDMTGAPMAGAVVILQATGTGNTLTQPGPTNASGVTTGTLASTVGEIKTVSALANGIAITQTASVTVQAFSPADLTGLVMWCKADALVLTDGDPVASFTDSSGNGNAPTQLTAAKRPTYRTNVVNSKPVARFDGVDDVLTIAANPLSGAAAGTAFVVVKIVNDPASGTAQGGPLGLFGSDSEHSLYPYDGNGNIYETFGTTARKILGNPVPSLASWRVYGLVSAANDYRAYLDGVQLFQTGTNTVGWWGGTPVIGATRPDGTGFQLLGDIAEILLYSRALSDPERQQVETYLADKYGLTLP